MEWMGMSTLLLSSSLKVGWVGEGCAGSGGASEVAGGDGSCNGLGGAGAGAVVGTLGLRRGDRRGGVGEVLRPGALRRVTWLCRRGAFRSVRGAVGLLDNVGSTLGGGVTGTSTLGDCCWLSW